MRGLSTIVQRGSTVDCSIHVTARVCHMSTQHFVQKKKKDVANPVDAYFEQTLLLRADGSLVF